MLSETVGNILKRKAIQEVISVPSTATIAEAVALMSSKGTGAVLIRSANSPTAGIITERDLMRRVLNEGRDPKTTPVTAVMSPEVRRVASGVSVEEALRLMVVHNHRHLVVADGNAVAGVVSIRDLMEWVVMPDAPVAAEGRVGVIKARAADAIDKLQHR